MTAGSEWILVNGALKKIPKVSVRRAQIGIAGERGSIYRSRLTAFGNPISGMVFLKIAFIATMPPRAYSGGRLTALTYAESAARSGFEVDFFTNWYPRMAREFKKFSRVNYRVGDLNSPPVNKGYDWVIFVPHIAPQSLLHSWAQLAETIKEGSVAMINFETPNWMGEMLDTYRPLSSWEGWLELAARSSLIISLSKEGSHYARQFYLDTEANFSYCYPSVNSPVADSVLHERQKKREVVWLTRVDNHKGLDFLENLLEPQLRRFRITVHLGNGKINSAVQKKLQSKANKAEIQLRIKGPVSGRKKFEVLSRSAVLLFPTRFEGFGIPPLEAGYCGTQVVASDLPVIREYAGNRIHYFSNSDPQSLPAIVANAAEAPISREARDYFRALGNLERCGERLVHLLSSS